MKKMLMLILSTLTLLTIGININTTVNAKPKFASSYWFRERKVTIKHQVTAYKVKVIFPEYKDRFIKKLVLKPGTKITVKNGGASWSWVVRGHGMKNNQKYFWIVNNPNTKWIK